MIGRGLDDLATGKGSSADKVADRMHQDYDV